MNRALEALEELAGDRPKVLVLGEMAELGEQTVAAHVELGRRIGQSGCQALYFRGPSAREVAKGLEEAGYQGRFECCDNPEQFVESLSSLGLGRAVALFKGSRRARMEEFLEALRAAMGGKL